MLGETTAPGVRLGTPPVLMYHSISPSRLPDPHALRVHPARLDRHLRLLARLRLRGVSLSELVRAQERGESRGLVGLTFDDGYTDFLEHAVPVLERHGMTGTVYVVAGRLAGANDWDDGPRLDLMGADQVRAVAAAGHEVGSHTLSHARLAGAGAATLACGPRPRVAVLSTGDELVPPGTPLGPGQIHDSNAIAIAALARRAGADVVLVGHVADTPEATEDLIGDALGRADVLVCTGGVSVGPHDHVKPALTAQDVEEVFWRVALRPGKPTWFGTRGSQLVFGLPGNPVSAMVTFLLFARPALRALQGGDPQVPRTRAVLAQAVRRHAGRDECVRVRLENGRATPTGAQGSHRLTSMLGADGFAIVTRGDGEAAAGDEVEVELLP